MATTVSLKPNAVEISGSTSGTTTLQATAVAGTTTLTLPAATDTLVGRATTDTLTNKTLSTPSISSPTISDGTANGVAYLNGSKVLTTGSALVFDGSNLGVGVTPSAKLDVVASNFVGGPAIGARFNTSNARIGFNIANSNGFPYIGYNTNNVSGSDTPTYDLNQAAAQLRMDGGSFKFNIAASGTAGAGISFTQAMTLDASGNLGVGTTSPNSRLQVSNASASTNAIAQFTNGTTGTGAGNGLYVGVDTSNEATIFNFYNSALKFGTNSTERARIDSSGRLIIGNTTMPVGYGTALNVYTTGLGARVYGTAEATGPFWVDKQTNTSSTSQVFVQFTINTQSTGNGQINGNGASQVAFGSFSDARLKENIVDLPPQLANIMALRPVEFDYIESEGGGHQTSFVAQEFEEVYPDAIGERPDGMKTLTGWGKTEARLVKAIQEQQALITQLTARITALEGA
jgi:hypothetical protein